MLFLLGALGFLVLNTQKITDNFKENVSMSIFLKNGAKQADIKQLQKSLSVAEYCKSVTFVSKEEAAEIYSKELGEDFVSFIGDNPLQNSFDLKLKADFVTPEKMADLSEKIERNASVSEVAYDKPMISKIHENVNKISVVLLVVSGLFTLVAMFLINSSIRLSVYSKRFIIKTMQLVGATKSFIRRPFIITNILLGLLGAVLAGTLLLLCLFYLDNYLPELRILQDWKGMAFVFAGILLMGVAISWVSTYFAAQRFLNLSTDDLYL